MCACLVRVSMRRGAPSSPRAPSRGKMVSGALQLETKLCEALQGGEDAMVENLLRQGADPNRVLSGGIAAIHLAAGMEQVSGIRCLARILQYGGDPNVKSVDGLTPLHVAASWGHDTRLRLLLMEGGNPWLEDQEGNTVLDLARKHRNEACVQTLCGILAEMEEEPSSWMCKSSEGAQRRAESFLSTVTEDTWEAGGASEFYGPSVPFGRTPEREMVHPLGPQSCFFPSIAATSERGGTSENGLDKPASLEDWPLSSFLTECSWQDMTWHEPGGLPPHLAPPRDPPVSSVGKQASEGSVGNAVQGTKLPARRVEEASVETRRPPSVENSIDEQGGLSPDPSGFPLQATLSRSESCPPGANPEIPSAPGSQEIPKLPLACTEDPECKTDSERRDADATLNLTQYSSFLDPDLVVKLGHQEGLDVTSPDHVYLFSRANPVPVSDLEKTLVAPAFQPGREQGGCSEAAEPCGRGSDGGGLSLYASCHSECHVSGTDTSSYNQAHKSGEQKASFARLADCSGTPLLGLLCRGLCCEAAASPPLWVSLDESEDVGPLQRGTCDREASSGPNPEKESLDSQSQGRVSEGGPSPLSQDKALTRSASQKEGNGDLNTRPLQDRTTPQAESEDLPEGPPLPRGVGVAAEKPRGEDGRRTVPDGWAALGEEKGEAESGGVSMSTQIVLEKTLWAQDTGLIQRPSGDTNASPSCGSTVLPGLSEDAGPTIPVLDQPASDAGEEPSSLEAKLRSMMLATKIRHSPLVQSNGGPCHITVQTTTLATLDSSGSSSLFEETLEMPRRPPRVRSPEAKALSTGQAPRGATVLNATDPPGKEMGERKNAPFVFASPSSPQPGSGPSGLLASPALLTDAGRSSCFQPEANAGVDCFADLDPKSPAEEKELSPLSREEGCTSLERVAAAPSWTDPEWLAVRGGKTKGPPRPSRVSFSRLSAGGLPCLPAASTGQPSRRSPVVQAVSLSPGGRPIHMSAAKPVEYLYVDDDQGHSLVERHVPCTDDSLADTTAGSEDTIIYDWRAYIGQAARPARQGSSPPRAASEAGRLSDEALVRKLRDLGVNPGPVTGLTRKLYVQLLEKLMSDPKTKARKATSGYSPELSSALETYQIPDGKRDEMALAGQFDQPDKSKKWREGLLKSSFNYLLLDPRVTQNLPFRSQFLSQAECFRTFVSAIFYVGKGKRSRPYSHLYEALNHYKGKSQEKRVCSKVRHILEIWASAQGVVSMHCFQNVIPVEAYTREACMVDAIGLRMLTNQKKGNYYGVVAGWPMKRRRCLGVHLLHRAMQIFLAEGERQLRPADIRTGP
uniref:Ankyrin repeat and LEM domain-containing protein 1 isoform X1 n=1 Tax=Pogona vitticeps TaxID=103695 RepID=A0A6J0SS47_9SAUR